MSWFQTACLTVSDQAGVLLSESYLRSNEGLPPSRSIPAACSIIEIRSLGSYSFKIDWTNQLGNQPKKKVIFNDSLNFRSIRMSVKRPYRTGNRNLNSLTPTDLTDSRPYEARDCVSCLTHLVQPDVPELVGKTMHLMCGRWWIAHWGAGLDECSISIGNGLS